MSTEPLTPATASAARNAAAVRASEGSAPPLSAGGEGAARPSDEAEGAVLEQFKEIIRSQDAANAALQDQLGAARTELAGARAAAAEAAAALAAAEVATSHSKGADRLREERSMYELDGQL